MLTDIFAERYATVPIWQNYGEGERRLLVQAFRIVSEQLFPYWTHDGKARDGAKATWKSMHDRLSMELGVQELAARGYPAERILGGHKQKYWAPLTYLTVCNNFVCAAYDGSVSIDQFMKERLSFVEIAFRDRENALAKDAKLKVAQAELLEHALPGSAAMREDRAAEIRGSIEFASQVFRRNVDEFNERLRRAGTNLNYHNGFIQIAEDQLIEGQIETPFWSLVKDHKWANVDTDMKEAIDRRDGGGRDPAFYAAKALESTIKIISNEKGWTHGGERGAHSYIDNLASAKNGAFIAKWEQSALKLIFTDIRNDLGHGAGDKTMPELMPQQTSWTIETCMAWIKSLILRT